MVVTNMKELCAYAKAQRKFKADEHRRLTLHESTFSKARKFTHNRMWRETTKKFTVEQLKLIKTL